MTIFVNASFSGLQPRTGLAAQAVKRRETVACIHWVWRLDFQVIHSEGRNP
jgi:hypothetical protein